VRLAVHVRDMLVASWRTDAASVARTLSHGLLPAEIAGEHLVSAAFFRYAGGRLGRLPVPPFSQLNLRVYTSWEGEPAAYFLDVRVSPLGKLGALVFPVRATRLRVRAGHAEGLGLRLAYSVDEPLDPGELGAVELGLLSSGVLKALRIRRSAAEWRRAELRERPGLDPVLALGFDVGEPHSLLYCAETTLEAELPPVPVSPPRATPSSRI
jgi:Uncharacterized conserved protein (COG2071)